MCVEITDAPNSSGNVQKHSVYDSWDVFVYVYDIVFNLLIPGRRGRNSKKANIQTRVMK